MKKRQTQFIRILSFFIAIQLVLTASPAFATVFQSKVSEQRTQLSPGVYHQFETYQSSKVHEAVHLLDVRVDDPYTEIEPGFPNPLNSLTRTTSQAKQNSYNGHWVVGATNASFFQAYDRMPANLLAVDNKIVNYGILGAGSDRPTNTPVAFGINANGKAQIDYYQTNLRFTVNGQSYSIDRLNEVRGEDMSVLYTSAKSSTGTNEWGTEIIVTGASKNTSSLSFGDKVTGKISKITRLGEGGNATVPDNGFVISVHGKEKTAELANLQAGQAITVDLGIDMKWQNAKFILAAGPLLVKNGAKQISMDEASSFARDRHPRTAIAVDASGNRVFMVTVDGRQSGYSNGTSLPDLANYLISKGAAAAINLDGGGSTTMAVRKLGDTYPTLANKPSDGTERSVSTILQAISKTSLGNVNSFKLKKPAGNIVIGTSFNAEVLYALDSYFNRVNIDPAKITWSVEGNIGSMTGNNFKATTPGEGKVIANYNGIRAEIPITVVDLFPDLSPNHWAFEDIKYLSSREVIRGYPDGTFHAEASISRADAAIMIARELQLKLDSITDPGFTDVSSDLYAYREIAAVAKQGIINGRSEGVFAPRELLTRAEMAAILKRAYQLTSSSSEMPFSDVKSSFWGYDAILALFDNGITTGYPDRTFLPQKATTRAEFSAFMSRTIK